MATAPYLENGRWYIDKDANDERYYVANVTQDLIDSGTTAVSYVLITQGVTELEKAAPQGDLGGLLIAKLGGMGQPNSESFCTFRVTCANGERFDRTIWFKEVVN